MTYRDGFSWLASEAVARERACLTGKKGREKNPTNLQAQTPDIITPLPQITSQHVAE